MTLEGATAFECCGVRIDATPFDDAVDDLCASAGAGSRAVHLCNAYTLALASQDVTLAGALNRGDKNFADGMPLVWIARALGFSEMTRRVYGPELMAATLDRGRASGLRHFLLGATPGVLEKLRLRVQSEWPGVVIAGTHAPPFGEFSGGDMSNMLDSVHAASPDVVWVGLGTPKQDLFVDRHRDEVASTWVAIGAAFDFLGGNKRQAPEWIREHGFEWAFRLATEPRRLWRRYLVGNLRFLLCTSSRRNRPRVSSHHGS